MGECLISNRKKSEPFNPFAPNAAQERKRMQESRPPQQKRPEQRLPPSTVEPVQKTLQERQAESKQQLQEQGDVTQTKFVESRTTTAPKPQPFNSTNERATNSSHPKILSTEERRAKLAEQSKTLKKEVQVITEVTKSDRVHIEPEPAKVAATTGKVNSSEVVVSLEEEEFSDEFQEGKKRRKSSRKDVFKKIETKVIDTSDRRRPKRRIDQRGGGSQKKEKKLDSKRSIEYRFAAREILDSPSVAEIHRSNILGQVWAKGERMGIDVAIEFIDEKINEGILSQDIGQQLKGLVKEMTTRR